MKDDNQISYLITDVILLTFTLLVALPFTYMVAWNVLAVGLFGTFKIGYGGAWALMVLRSLFFGKVAGKNDETYKESLGDTVKGILKYVFVLVLTVIIGLSLGYL